MKKRQKILVVDDAELNRAIIAELFHEDYDIIEAENGEDALILLEKNIDDIAVMLLDIIMPVMDGFKVMEIMNSHYWVYRVPVVMITTDTSENSMQRGYELGAADVITKPFNSSIVKQRVNNIIELYRHKRNLERLASEQIDILRSQSEKVIESNIEIINVLSRIINLKNGKTIPKSGFIKSVTAAIMREYSKIHPELNIDRTRINTVAAAAVVCDIGEIFVPNEILNKSSSLNEDEYKSVKNHSLDGAKFIERISEANGNDELLSCCCNICLYHHERADGNGYPYGITQNDIPFEAQIVSIASVYDALVSDRPYRKAYVHEAAVNMILNGECGVFSEDVLKAFKCAEPIITDEFKDYIENDDSDEVTETANSERVLRLLEKERTRYLILSDMSGDVMFEYESESNTVTFSDSFSELTGLNSKYVDGDKFVDISEAMFEDDKLRLNEIFNGLSAYNPSLKTEVRLKLKNGTYRWYEMYAHSSWNDDKCISVMGKLVNIDRQKREMEQWRRAADTDPLTQIYNKAAVQNYITDAFEIQDDTMSALCFIDLDNFKGINDNYGHQFGDMVLQKVAEQIRMTVRNSDIVGRIGGDEFVVFLRGIGSRKNISAKAEQLCSVFKLNCGECKISGSIGIACYPDDGVNFDELLGKADNALYCCKGSGKDRYIFYDENYCSKLYKSLLTEPER